MSTQNRIVIRWLQAANYKDRRKKRIDSNNNHNNKRINNFAEEKIMIDKEKE